MCRRSSLLCPPVIAVRTDVSSPSGHYIPGTSYQEIFIKKKKKKKQLRDREDFVETCLFKLWCVVCDIFRT